MASKVKRAETRGRPPLPEAQRLRNLTVRVTLDGIARLERAAQRAGASVPEYVRAWIARLR